MLDFLAPAAAAVAEHGGGHAKGPVALGIDDYGWVALAMAILLLVFVIKKVPGKIAGGLDAKIAEIRHQLEEAKTLRAEAEALRDEYAAKIAGAERDAEAMMAGARQDADAILAKAAAESEVMIARRQRMAEDKIAAAERAAVTEVKARAVTAAAAASRRLIAERHDGAADKALADRVISSL